MVATRGSRTDVFIMSGGVVLFVVIICIAHSVIVINRIVFSDHMCMSVVISRILNAIFA